MSNSKHLESLIIAFNKWFKTSLRKKYRNSYSSSITKSHLEELNESRFKRFFLEFVREGGKVQSRGHRNIGDFEKTIDSKYQEFRMFAMLPFKEGFNLRKWFDQKDDFLGLGIGIATIYLNRINPQLYPIFNNKTRKGVNKLGYKLSTSNNFTNYKKVQNYQDELIERYPQLENYYKADAINQFIVGEPKGKFLIVAYQQTFAIENGIEQAEIDFEVQENEDPNEAYNKIKSCENDKSEQIIIKGRAYKRNSYLFSLIKKYRNYTCQFCSTRLPIGDGRFYVEACHINSKSEGGKDKLSNVLVLCPNCHKVFDYLERKDEKKSDNQYEVKLNGNTYTASLS